MASDKDFHPILKKHGFKPKNKGAFASWFHADNPTKIGFARDGKAYLDGWGGTFTFSKPEVLDNYLAKGKHLNKSKLKESSDMKHLVESAINKDAVSFKEIVESELRARIGEVLEGKLSETEDLQELSNKTLGKYIAKASREQAHLTNARDKLYDLAMKVSQGNYHDASRELWDGKKDSAATKKLSALDNAQRDASEEISKKANRYGDKATKRTYGISRAIKKIKD